MKEQVTLKPLCAAQGEACVKLAKWRVQLLRTTGKNKIANEYCTRHAKKYGALPKEFRVTKL